MTNRVAHQFTEALADVGGRGKHQVERVLEAPTGAFRAEVIDLGFEVLGRAYSIVPFVIGDKALSASVSEDPPCRDSVGHRLPIR